MTPVAVSWRGRLVRRLADYLALTKPGVVLMVLVTTAAGYSALPPRRRCCRSFGTWPALRSRRPGRSP